MRDRGVRFVVLLFVLGLVGPASATAAPLPGSFGNVFSTAAEPGGEPAGVAVESGRVVLARQGSYGTGGWTPSVVEAFKASGAPDPAFGQGGRAKVMEPAPVTPIYGFDGGMVFDIALQPDGRPVLAGVAPGSGGRYLVLERLTAAGAPDPTFGQGGYVLVRKLEANAYGGGGHLLLQADGKLLVSVNPRLSGEQPLGLPVVARVLSSGEPDSSFGTGGVVTLSTPSSEWRGPSLAIQPGGRILLAPDTRLHPDGTPDPTFSGAQALDRMKLPRGAQISSRPDTLVLPDGRVRALVGLTISHQLIGPPESRMGVVALTADGRVEGRFGVNGLALPKLRYEWVGEDPGDIVADKRGSIIIAGGQTTWPDTPRGVAHRILADGTTDRSFGHRGRAATPPPDSTVAGAIVRLTLDIHSSDILAAFGFMTSHYGTEASSGIIRLHNTYDRARPTIRVASRCIHGATRLRVRVRDRSGLASLSVHAGSRRRTTRHKTLRVSIPPQAHRAVIAARDLAGNRRVKRIRVASCGSRA